MSDRQVQAEIAGLLEAARPELTSELEARAVAAVAGARRPSRSRRLVAVAVGAAVALFGLGFVPIPIGKAKGALDKAVAALEGTTGLYIRYHNYGQDKETVEDFWSAPGFLMRDDRWENGRLVSTQIEGPDEFTDYDAAEKTARVFDSPPPRAEEPPGGDDLWWMNPARAVDFYRGQPGATVTEWQERSLWGGEVNVIEITLPPGAGGLKQRWETDPATGRLLSEKMWQGTDGDWKLVRETEEVRWEELPESTWEFVPPKGTTVRYARWWKPRMGEPIAGGESESWRIVLFSIEADRQGNLVLTLSRWPTAGFGGTPLGRANWNGGEPVEIEGADNLGVTYQHENWYRCVRDYWMTTLRRSDNPIVPGHAQTVTLTVHPYQADGYEDETIVLPDIPLPPLTDKVTDFETEVVQY